MGVVRQFLTELLPLDLVKFLKIPVSVQYLSKGLMNPNDILYTDVSWEDAGQFQR